jgi:hypothetical protein
MLPLKTEPPLAVYNLQGCKFTKDHHHHYKNSQAIAVEAL